MSTIFLSMASPGLKRPYQATVESSPSKNASTTELSLSDPNPSLESPAKASDINEEKGAVGSRDSTPLSNAITNPCSPESVANSSTPTAAGGDASQKRRKLTFAEKEVQRIEKQFKEQQKAEEKARREEEKRLKEEQKKTKEEEKEAQRKLKEEEKETQRKAKEAEKEEKRKAKEAKDAVKEEERRRKETEKKAREDERKAREDEKAKKEKSQLRLNAFFAKPAASPGSATSSRRGSLASIDDVQSTHGSRVDSEVPEKRVSDYERTFPPFFLHSNTTVAPADPFPWNAARLEQARATIDKHIKGECSGVNSIQSGNLKRHFTEALHLPDAKRQKRRPTITPVKELIARINGTTSNLIDLTEQSTAQSRAALDALRKVPMKYIRYAEDVRPPYIGTFTKVPAGRSITSFCRNPFARALPAVNYDYDSEAEWEEPEEGEDLNSEDEEEPEDEDGDDMEGFLDDEEAEASGAKRRLAVMGDIEPVCTDLHWAHGSPSKGPMEVEFGKTTLDLKPFRLAPLLVEARGTIDPYSTKYWNTSADTVTMPPPRIPLNNLPSATNFLFPNSSVKSTTTPTAPSAVSGTSAAPKSKAVAPAKPMPAELLEDFKRAVEGSDLTKAGLIEVLKKRFPQVTKNTVQETLLQVAKREGKKEAEKKWVLI